MGSRKTKKADGRVNAHQPNRRPRKEHSTQRVAPSAAPVKRKTFIALTPQGPRRVLGVQIDELFAYTVPCDGSRARPTMITHIATGYAVNAYYGDVETFGEAVAYVARIRALPVTWSGSARSISRQLLLVSAADKRRAARKLTAKEIAKAVRS